MKKIKYIIFISFFLIISAQICVAGVVTDIEDQIKDAGTVKGPYAGGTNKLSLSQIAGLVVSSFLALLGIIFIVLIILAGYHWMTASGDEEKVTKAKETLNRALIGLLIVLGSYAIWNFVFVNLINK